MASIHAMVNEIHVLLVDHDTEALINTAKQLQKCQYRVTCVELASAGISILLSGDAKFDVVMANINSPDLHGLKLLQHSVNLCIPVVLMSDDDNAFIAMRALEDGAFLYIKKPLPMEFHKCLWQHVVREKSRMVRERDMYVASNNIGSVRGVEFREAVHCNPSYPNPNRGVEFREAVYCNPNYPNPNPNRGVEFRETVHCNPNQGVEFREMAHCNPNYPNPNRGVEFREVVHCKPNYPNPNTNMMMVMKNEGKSKSKSRGRNDDNNEEYDLENHAMKQKDNVRRKMCTEWTRELHAKFMNAIEQLGEGRCFPKEILEIMNEPGLTRMQVASHLQKCRNDNWRSPDERKVAPPSALSADTLKVKPRIFGSKPLTTGALSGQSQRTSTQETGQGSGALSGQSQRTSTQETGQGSGTRSKCTGTPKMGNRPTMTNNGTNSSSSMRSKPDEYFNFLDMDGPTRGHLELGINDPGQAQQGYNDDGQKSGGASSISKSHWSSDTSNLDSDHSAETKTLAHHD